VSWPATNLPGMSNAGFSQAVISADSRFVVFIGTPPLSTPGKPALIRVDLNDNSAVMITNNFPTVSAGNEGIYGPSITDDGQTVVWSNGVNILRWNAATGITDVVDGGDPTLPRHSDSPQISGDGQFVLFVSDATNVVAGVGGSGPQIYIRDTQAGVTRLISHDPSGNPVSDLETYYADLSPDGKSVLIETTTPELIANDSNSAFDVFEWDSASGNISLLTPKQSDLNSATGNGNSSAGAGSISARGRYVVFKSTARLTANDTNDVNDVYLLDRLQQTTTLISAKPDGFSPGAFSGPAMITPDGKWVVFESNAVGLAGVGDTRTAHNVYARNVDTGEMLNISGTLSGAASLRRLSANSRYVFLLNGTTLLRHDLADHSFLQVGTNSSDVFCSADGNRVSFIQNGVGYLRDLPDGAAVRFGTALPLLTADGSTLVYRSTGGIVVSNIDSGINRSFPMAGAPGIVIDPAARIIAYQIPATSSATNAIGFIDTVTGENVLVSRAFGASTNGNDSSTAPVISADGRFIAFESWASNLVENDSNNTKDVFLYDRYLNRLSLVSHKASSDAPGDSLSANPFFSPDGGFLLFLSFASDLVANDRNAFGDVFLTAIVGADSTEDTDGDGLPDWWERANFSTLKYGSADDFDGDGFSNGAEFRAGTNPIDAASSLTIKSIQTTTDSARRIVWNTAPGKRYVLETKSAVDAAQWTQVGNTFTADSNEAAVIDANTVAPAYYRIRLVE
jgi:Tol biopolymer transport system component